jgi:hypothetical protein
MPGDKQLERLKLNYWRNLILYVDLLEATYESASHSAATQINDLQSSSIESCRDEEDRAWSAYLNARNGFIAALTAANAQQRVNAISPLRRQASVHTGSAS